VTRRPAAVIPEIAVQATAPAAATRHAGQAAPVIILGYPHSGAAQLQSLLSDSTMLACTSGTGLLPLCEQAAAVWRQVEDRDTGQVSALAAASIRAMTGALATQILATAGKSRWCELAMASPQAAETFLILYPAARFVCVHRCLSDVARTALQAAPWGLAGPGYAPFLAAYPASTLAALAAWWSAHTNALLTFEKNHPHECLQIRYEDFTADQPTTASAIASFLGFSDTAIPAATDQPHLPALGDTDQPAGPAPQPPIPATQLPPPLLTQINDLLERLSYPQLTS
jgi:Sulfotransferase family